jgi:hypothetical protein
VLGYRDGYEAFRAIWEAGRFGPAVRVSVAGLGPIDWLEAVLTSCRRLVPTAGAGAAEVVPYDGSYYV